MIHKDTKRWVLLWNKDSFSVKMESFKEYVSLSFCLEHVMKKTQEIY